MFSGVGRRRGEVRMWTRRPSLQTFTYTFPVHPSTHSHPLLGSRALATKGDSERTETLFKTHTPSRNWCHTRDGPAHFRVEYHHSATSPQHCSCAQGHTPRQRPWERQAGVHTHAQSPSHALDFVLVTLGCSCKKPGRTWPLITL